MKAKTTNGKNGKANGNGKHKVTTVKAKTVKHAKKHSAPGYNEDWEKTYRTVSGVPARASDTTKRLIKIVLHDKDNYAIAKGNVVRLMREDTGGTGKTLFVLRGIAKDLPSITMRPRLYGQTFKEVFPTEAKKGADKAWHASKRPNGTLRSRFNYVYSDKLKPEANAKNLLIRIKRIVPELAKQMYES